MDQQQNPQTPAPPDDDLTSLLGSGTTRGRRSTLTVVLAVVAIAALGLIAGLFIGKSMDDSSGQAAFPNGFGPSGPVGDGGGGAGLPNGANGQFTIGTIESIDGDTITVATTDGGTVTIEVGDGTQIQVTDEGSISDLAEGDTIVATGSRSGDTIDADSISEGGGLAGAGPPLGGASG
jgi:hypothetical protein